MIYPTSESLLAGVVSALEETVLPDLARGTAARKQLQAALAVLRHVAFALPAEADVLAANNADMAAVLAAAAGIPAVEPVSPADTDPTARNLALQQQLIDLQESLPGLPEDRRTQITPLLIGLHKRMTDRAVALIPPAKARK